MISKHLPTFGSQIYRIVAQYTKCIYLLINKIYCCWCKKWFTKSTATVNRATEKSQRKKCSTLFVNFQKTEHSNSYYRMFRITGCSVLQDVSYYRMFRKINHPWNKNILFLGEGSTTALVTCQLITKSKRYMYTGVLALGSWSHIFLPHEAASPEDAL